MKQLKIKFSSGTTTLYLAAGFSHLKKIADQKACVLLTDENIYKAHRQRFKGWNVIVLKSGESYKVQPTIDALVAQLIEMEAGRSTTLVGVGGGVITDITGYLAAVYMRGLKFGFVPTSILGMVDASIGGKNGIDVGDYKNMVGTIKQPDFILHDMAFLKSLPQQEWVNGFAEVIKHACIKDKKMFEELEQKSLRQFQQKQKTICELVQRNTMVKVNVVKRDEFERNERRMLNFGHTLGHALETQYELLHGQAISIGMAFACYVSEKLCGFKETERVEQLLSQYHLPMAAAFDKQRVFNILKMDKKREKRQMNFVLLNKIGKAVVHPVSLVQLEKLLTNWE
ncbi:MAG TPA: 3-dehydroquinate synthase [Chitinophagaceae bacterium]|nr:3-dehydroquinate synthase [Chitinophagaceae bacterium]